MSKLDGVHPKLVAAVEKIQFVMSYIGHPMMVTDGVRTLQQQQRLYQQGRGLAGPIVTHADGLAVKSNHQMKADGYGHAVDMCFVVNGRPSWDEGLPWKLYGEVAKSLGLDWGGDWRRPDKPHIEMVT